MAVHRGETQVAKQTRQRHTTAKRVDANVQHVTTEAADEHLPPLPLVFTVLICSGALLMFAIRDMLGTGKVIAGPWDESMLLFTKSTMWFDDSKGWKSTQGGLSAIAPFTSDANNMGGFFVRKVAGAATVAVHMQKMVPLLAHPTGAQWIMGHFHPLLWTSLVGNVATAAFYTTYWEDLVASGVQEFTQLVLSFLAVESLVLLYYLICCRPPRKSAVAVAMSDGKTPSSLPSRIVTRTVAIVTTLVAIIAGRDLFFPGSVIEIFPRDDIYLEWTNAFLHSPPDGSPEALDQGLEAPLYIGDKFISQLMALHILILCMYKFVSATLIRLGNDGSGTVKCKMIWRGQMIGDALVFLIVRLFTPSAGTASLDLRWHLMCLAYETFILGLYGFF